MQVTEEQIRTIIAEFKELADVMLTMTTDGVEAEELAQAWFRQNENFHGDWSKLGDETRAMWVWFARAAIQELNTGKPIPSN